MSDFVAGSIIAALISAIATWLGVWYEGHRQERRLTNEREVMQKQLAHDREQEIRGRRTEALVVLHDLLETQARAISYFSGFCGDPKRFTDPSEFDEWRTVFRLKAYRARLWPIEDTPVVGKINKYAREIKKLQTLLTEELFSCQKGDPELVSKIDAAGQLLSGAMIETRKLTSSLNKMD